MATVALAYASSSCTICSSSDSSRKDFLRPPVRKPTLVWARRTVWAVIPAQVVTPLETMESLEDDTQLLARNKLVMSLRLRSTARLDLASGWKSQRSKSHSTTNVFNSMYVSTWDIPKDRKKSTWQRAFLLDVLAKLPLCAIVGNKFRVSHANYRLICNLRDPCTAWQHQSPFLATRYSGCFRKRCGQHAREAFSFAT